MIVPGLDGPVLDDGSLSALRTWLWGSSLAWLVGAFLLASAIPFTLLVIKPVNDRLLSPDLDPAAPETTALLAQWSRLHAVRTIAGLLAFLCFAAA